MPKDQDLFPEAARFMGLLLELQERESLQLLAELLAQGVDPLKIVACCQTAMKDVGKYYEKGRYYLSGLMMAGEILRQIMETVAPILQNQIHGSASGRVMIGTVQGDIHDIGKNQVAMLLRCHGFDVLDLGVDVPPEEFVNKSKEFAPDIIGLSVLLTTAHDAIRETIKLLSDRVLKESRTIKIMVGGGFMNDQICRYVGADYWARDAISGVRYCQTICH